MNKLLSLIVLWGGLLLVSGCWSSSSETTTLQTQALQITEKHTGLAVCDKYLTAVKCLIDNSTGSDQSNLQSSYESLVASFKDVPVDQLQATCTNLSNALRSHPTLLKDHPMCSILQ